MAQVDSLLKILVNNGGDELVLALGEAPLFLGAGAPLRLFLRAMGPDRHTQLVGEILGPARATQLKETGAVSFSHEAGELGTFHVTVRGAEVPRVRIVRPGGVAEPPPEPVVEEEEEVPVAPITAPSIEGGLHPRLGELLEQAATRRASDLHLASGEPAVLRIDGRLSTVGPAVGDVATLLGPLLGDRERRALDDGDSVDQAVETPSGHRFRVNVFRCDQGIGAAFRVLPKNAPEFGTLGLPPAVADLADLPHGLVLLCGPTGCGKSTTLAALAWEALRRRRGVLITLEDPIEYHFPRLPGTIVRQRQIGRHVRDFATGLRDALREDPDLLLVGEMRDPESIQLALTAAETGHLVLASLHSRTAASAVERIVDTYAPERQRQIRVQLADALRAVVSQRLLPRADGAGRVPAVEVLRITSGAANLIREGKTPSLVSVIQTGASGGMIPLERSVRDLVRAGVVSASAAAEILSDGEDPGEPQAR